MCTESKIIVAKKNPSKDTVFLDYFFIFQMENSHNSVPFRTSRWKESERLTGKNGYRHPVKVVYNKKTMTYKTIESKSDIQFLNRSELEFYREAAKTNPHIKIIEMDEDEILYLNWNQPPQLTEEEIMELAQKVRQETEKEELVPKFGTESEEIAQSVEEQWNLSGSIYECILRYAKQLNEEQLNEILLGMEHGLSEKQVKTYFTLPVEKMRQYRRAYEFSRG